MINYSTSSIAKMIKEMLVVSEIISEPLKNDAYLFKIAEGIGSGLEIIPASLPEYIKSINDDLNATRPELYSIIENGSELISYDEAPQQRDINFKIKGRAIENEIVIFFAAAVNYKISHLQAVRKACEKLAIDNDAVEKALIDEQALNQDLLKTFTAYLDSKLCLQSHQNKDLFQDAEKYMIQFSGTWNILKSEQRNGFRKAINRLNLSKDIMNEITLQSEKRERLKVEVPMDFIKWKKGVGISYDNDSIGWLKDIKLLEDIYNCLNEEGLIASRHSKFQFCATIKLGERLPIKLNISDQQLIKLLQTLNEKGCIAGSYRKNASKHILVKVKGENKYKFHNPESDVRNKDAKIAWLNSVKEIITQKP